MCQHIIGVYRSLSEFIGVYDTPGVYDEDEFIGVYDTVMSLVDYHHLELMIHSKTSGLSAPADKKTLKTQEDIGERGNLSLSPSHPCSSLLLYMCTVYCIVTTQSLK